MNEGRETVQSEGRKKKKMNTRHSCQTRQERHPPPADPSPPRSRDTREDVNTVHSKFQVSLFLAEG